MAINLTQYDTRFGKNHRIMLEHPKLGPGLVFFCKNQASGGWRSRRFDGKTDLTHRELSGLTVSEIENDATYSEVAPRHSVKHVSEWAAYLKLRRMVLDAHGNHRNSQNPPDVDSEDDEI